MRQGAVTAKTTVIVNPTLFAASVFLNSALWQFLAVMALGTFIYEGEAAEGVGLLWFFSLPVTFLVALPSAPLFEPFSKVAHTGTKIAIYSGIVLGVAGLAPAVTLAWGAFLNR